MQVDTDAIECICVFTNHRCDDAQDGDVYAAVRERDSDEWCDDSKITSLVGVTALPSHKGSVPLLRPKTVPLEMSARALCFWVRRVE